VSKAPDFFSFTRSLEAYQKALAHKSRLVLTPQSPFLKYFR
jgi:membrane protease subunit HflC